MQQATNGSAQHSVLYEGTSRATHFAALYLANCAHSVNRIHALIDERGLIDPMKLAGLFTLQSVDSDEQVPGVYGRSLKLEVQKAELKEIDWQEIARQFTADLQFSLSRETVADVVREVLANDIVIDGNVLRLKRNLDRQDYLKVNKALTDIGGRWDRKAGGHVFEDDPSEGIEGIILTGKWEKRKDFDFFPTPSWLAETMVNLALIEPGMRVLEPEAGDAAIASIIRDLHPDTTLDVLELEDKRRQLLVSRGFNCVGSDFLSYNPGRVYHRIIMNPPFSGQQDIDHVMHASRLLLPGGRLTAVMSAGVTFRSNRKTQQFREWLSEHNGQIHNVPDKAFAAAGTSVRTVTVTADL